MAYDFAELSAARFDDELATLYVTSEERDNPVSNCAVVKLGASDAAISASKAPVSLRTTLKEIANTAYVDVKNHLVEKFGSTAKVFDEKVARDKLFMVEIEYISSLFEALRIQSLHPTDAKSAFRSIMINLSQLDTLAEEYGTSSEKYINGAAIMRQVLDEAIKSFTTSHKPSAVEILSVPPTIPAIGGTSPRPLLRRRATTSGAKSTTCPKSHDECVSVFNNCSRHGECAPTRVPSLNDVCFFCNCNGTHWTDDDGNPVDGYAPVKWTGNSCQYQDVTMGFHIILWSVVVLAVVLL
ncbi:hypothetical protein HDV00_000391 [Rhizophlyctis rosea]|nr:hypothetical protein HDV00_000391 [Rhizophlyctis rosea]